MGELTREQVENWKAHATAPGPVLALNPGAAERLADSWLRMEARALAAEAQLELTADHATDLNHRLVAAESALTETTEKVEWWRDMMIGLTALVDSHFDLAPGAVDHEARLRQVRQELHDMGAEWDTDWRSTNQQLHERAERAESALTQAQAELEQWKSMPTYGQGYWDAERSFMPTLERMVHGLTMDGEEITREQMRMMADSLLRPLKEKAHALASVPDTTEEDA